MASGADPPLTESPHTFLNPDGLLPGRGFSHVALPAAGRTVHVAGQTAHDADGVILAGTHDEQWLAALRNLVTALAAAEAGPEHVVALQIYVTDMEAYRRSTRRLGEAWRETFGTHYPALSLFGVAALADPDAEVEIVATAVVPDA